jgi:crotonobetainyl-CoA:carnitine CoA-transferase CaiB-like acyl-CoA transferase
MLNIAEMHHHPQTQAREMVTEVEHPHEGKVETIGLPIKLSETPGGVHRPSPLFGEHTREVLLEHGYDENSIRALENEKNVFCHSE